MDPVRLDAERHAAASIAARGTGRAALSVPRVLLCLGMVRTPAIAADIAEHAHERTMLPLLKATDFPPAARAPLDRLHASCGFVLR